MKILLITFSFLLFFFGCDNYKDLTKKELVISASENYSNGNKHKALDIINKAIEKYKDDRELIIMRGFINATLGPTLGEYVDQEIICKDFDVAYKLGYKIEATYLQTFFCDVETKPLPIKSLIELKYLLSGINYASNGKLENALDEFTEVIQLNPQNYEALYHISAINFYFIKDTTKAYDLVESALTLNKYFSNGYLLRGKIRQAKDDFIEAINDFNKAIQYDGDNAEAYYSRGKLYYRLNLPEKGMSDLMTANSKGHPNALK